jgi:hypothetical protein
MCNSRTGIVYDTCSHMETFFLLPPPQPKGMLWWSCFYDIPSVIHAIHIARWEVYAPLLSEQLSWIDSSVHVVLDFSYCSRSNNMWDFGLTLSRILSSFSVLGVIMVSCKQNSFPYYYLNVNIITFFKFVKRKTNICVYLLEKISSGTQGN